MNLEKKVMSFKLSTLLAASLLLVACSKGPQAKAPGSEPEDMTPEGHAAAAEGEAQEAQEHERMADEASEGYGERADVPSHEREAEKHGAFSDQHKMAGEKAADAGTSSK